VRKKSSLKKFKKSKNELSVRIDIILLKWSPSPVTVAITREEIGLLFLFITSSVCFIKCCIPFKKNLKNPKPEMSVCIDINYSASVEPECNNGNYYQWGNWIIIPFHYFQCVLHRVLHSFKKISLQKFKKSNTWNYCSNVVPEPNNCSYYQGGNWIIII
jgi:hypothetical protein